MTCLNEQLAQLSLKTILHNELYGPTFLNPRAAISLIVCNMPIRCDRLGHVHNVSFDLQK